LNSCKASIDGRTIGVEIRIGVYHAIECEIVKDDAVTASRDRLVGAIAALARLRLAGGRRKVADIRRQSHQIQVLAAIERKLRDVFRLDYGTDGRIFRLQQRGGSLNLHALVNLADLKREIQADGLLYLDFDVGAVDGPESRMFGLEIVDAGWNRRESVESITGALGVPDRAGAGVG